MLATCKQPRCKGVARVTTQLHGFCDASTRAYAAVVYVRATYNDQSPTCALIMAKTRVAPLKTLSIPRLELCGATLLANLLSSVRKALNIPVEHTYAWSDSTIVLSWLDGSPKHFKMFVGNPYCKSCPPQPGITCQQHTTRQTVPLGECRQGN